MKLKYNDLYQINNFDIPTYAVTALEYGDYSGLEQDDIDNLEEWLRLEFDGYTNLVFDWTNGIDEAETGDVNESSFCSSPAFGLAMDCIDCAVYGIKEF